MIRVLSRAGEYSVLVSVFGEDVVVSHTGDPICVGSAKIKYARTSRGSDTWVAFSVVVKGIKNTEHTSEEVGVDSRPVWLRWLVAENLPRGF